MMGTPLRLHAGGTLVPGKHVYIERPEDGVLLDVLVEGDYVNILTSRQMGKSSLVAKTMFLLEERGINCIYIDLVGQIGSTKTLDDYYLGILTVITRKLEMNFNLRNWWDSRRTETSNQKFHYFLLHEIDYDTFGSCIIFLDEIESTMGFSYADDMFTAIRSLYNLRSIEPRLEMLSFCLIGVATPNDLIKNKKTTAYNVGQYFDLSDFKIARDNLSSLQERLHSDPEVGCALLEKVMFWTNGHPFLTIIVCKHFEGANITSVDNIEKFVMERFDHIERVEGEVQTHVRQISDFLAKRVHDKQRFLERYENILNGSNINDGPDRACIELKLCGLVKKDADGDLEPRNRIYERLFNLRWIHQKDSVEKILKKIGVRLERNREGAVCLKFDELSSQKTLNQAAEIIGNDYAVESIDISFCDITSLFPLKEWRSLRVLDISETKVQDLSPLRNLSDLEVVRMDGTAVKDLAPLCDQSNLEVLQAARTPISKIDDLLRLRRLKQLNFRSTSISRTEIAEFVERSNSIYCSIQCRFEGQDLRVTIKRKP